MAQKQLSEYERKRDPKQTSEPFGAKGRKTKEPIFVVQRHEARRLHYDFRLERDGALASWAVPKGVPLEPGEQHLAVHVEDHPLDYATFEGEIPKGQYGAGTVEIWDSGTYELLEEKKNGGLTVRLKGNRLEGTWSLIPAHLGGDEKNWLILRKRDEAKPVPRAGSTYSPMLATLTEDVPRGAGWEFEVKWDGYRAIAMVSQGETTLTSRNGNDLTTRFAHVAKEIAKAVKTPDCVLHGEQEFVIAGFTKGTGRRASSFGSLVLGYYQGGELVYAGNVGTGFNSREIDKLLDELRPLKRPTSPFREVPKMPKVRKSDVIWVEPKLVCEVEFAEWTHDGRLRAPSYKGLREDKPAEDVRREQPIADRVTKGSRELKLSNL